MARLQAHLVKLAIIFSISRSDDRIISKQDFEDAKMMLDEASKDAETILYGAGSTDEAQNMEMFCAYVKATPDCSFEEAYRYVQIHFPNLRIFTEIFQGLVAAKKIEMRVVNGKRLLRYLE